jgi:hypothetical protein
MVLGPGESTTLEMEFSMHGDMAGPHNFLVRLATNDATRPEVGLTVLSDWAP